MFKVLDEVCKPKRATKYSAYVDLFAREDIIISAGETKIVKLGVKLDLEKLKNNYIKYEQDRDIKAKLPPLSKPFQEIYFNNEFKESHYLEVALRSSLGVKGLIISNGIGIIDLDYPDEIGLIVHNPLQLSSQKYESLVNGGVRYLDKFYAKGKDFKISKGDKVAQCTLKEHKGYLMGYETETLRVSGFGSTGER